MSRSREDILQCNAKVRLIEGKPGVGKTWFGCELAQHEILHGLLAGKVYQRVLFLTFARTAVARIRQVFSRQGDRNGGERSQLIGRLRIDTFCGFFWWLLESYGRYARNGSLKRPWLIGSREVPGVDIPLGYEGYTFEMIEARALELLRVQPVRKLLSDLFPLAIVDEFQDVHERLFEIVRLLAEDSRLVLLRGPGQCIYRNLPGKSFDPESVRQMCVERLNPKLFSLSILGNEKQRHCAEIRQLISQYEAGAITASVRWPVVVKAIPRKNRNGNFNHLETFACLQLRDMRRHARSRDFTCALLASTNQAVADLGRKLTEGSPAYELAPQSSSLLFGDNVLLQYGRLMLCLLKTHWIATKPLNLRAEDVAIYLSLLFQEVDSSADVDPSSRKGLADRMIVASARQRAPDNSSDWKSRLDGNLSALNGLLRETQTRQKKCKVVVPQSMPFDKADVALLEVLKNEFIASIKTCVNTQGHIDVHQAAIAFEKANQQKVIFEKLGIEKRVQVMTIHKSKGREFDGVVLVLEDSRKAIWRREGRATEEEIEDLYRVALSRAKSMFALVAFEDAWRDAAAPVTRLLPRPSFYARVAGKTGASP